MACPLRRQVASQTSARIQCLAACRTPNLPRSLAADLQRRIERALRHNLAGLLSEYNTIQARERSGATQRPAAEVSADVRR